MPELQNVPIEKIEAGEHDIRADETDDGIEELATSIRRIGMLVPLILEKKGDSFQLVSGHRRLLAAKRVGLSSVPCIIQVGDKARAAEVSFAENFFRKDLSPVELACAIRDCLENQVRNIKELARGFNRSEHWVREMVAITDWPKDVLEAMHNEKLSISAAANLAVITDDAYRAFLVRNAVESGATARTTAAWLQAWRAMQPAEEAVTAEPVAGTRPPVPLIPQAPCLCCGEIFPVDRMSHVPMCGPCIQTIRSAGMTAG